MKRPITARHGSTTQTTHGSNAAVNCTAMTDKPKMGRPTKPPEDKMVAYSIRLTPEQIVKLKLLTLDRLRAWIDKAKVRGE